MTAYLKSVDTGMKVEMAKQAAKDKNARIARQKLLKKHKAVLKKALNKEIAKLNARMKIWQGKLNKEAIAYEQKQKIRAVKLKNHKKKEESKKLKMQYQKQQKKETKNNNKTKISRLGCLGACVHVCLCACLHARSHHSC